MKNTKTTHLIVFICLLIAVMVYRYLVLVKFGFRYTDNDQTVMWSALMDYSNGVFHEPRFYGQNYSAMLEAFFAVPLYRIGIPNYMALPIITSLFALIPFVAISIFTFIKKNTTAGILIISIPLLLPIEYSLITTIPRGFVTGVFFASIGAISVFYQNKKWFFLAGFLAVFAYSVNPNSVIVSIPCLAFLFISNIAKPKFYLFVGLGMAVGFGLHFWVNYFYVLNPTNSIHNYELKYSLENLLKALGNLDSFYNEVSPIFWKNGFLYCLLFFVLGLFFMKKKKFSLSVFFILIPLLLIFTTCFEKIHDGLDSVFFSKSRMYLGLPVLIAISLSFLPKTNSKLLLPFLLIPIAFLTYKLSYLDESVQENTTSTRPHVVTVLPVEYVRTLCKNLNDFSKKHGVDLIVIRSYPNRQAINYACETCFDDFPKTLYPIYERRTWRMFEDEKKVYKTILILGDDQDAIYPSAEEVEEHHFLLRNNEIKTFDLLDSLNVDYRRFRFP